MQWIWVKENQVFNTGLKFAQFQGVKSQPLESQRAKFSMAYQRSLQLFLLTIEFCVQYIFQEAAEYRISLMLTFLSELNTRNVDTL